MEPTQLHQESQKDTPLIQCLRISKSYSQASFVLKNANLEIRNGEFVFLLGQSGSGKSTFFRLLLALEHLDQGHILIEGRNLQRLHPREIPFFRRSIGIVFQDLMLIQDRSVFENVALPLEVEEREHFFIRKKVHRLLRPMGLDIKMGLECSKLSMCEQQQVAIARAAINDPAILLVDEPSGSLDQRALHGAMALFRKINAQGATIVVATKDPALPATIPEGRVILMEEGKFVENVFVSSANGSR